MARRRVSTSRSRSSSQAAVRPFNNTPSPGVVWGIALVLAVLTIATYAAVRGFDFVELDDPVYVTENAQVRAGLTLEGVRWAFTTGTARHSVRRDVEPWHAQYRSTRQWV